MILTIIALAGAILGATTIAGLLMLYQIRQSTDLANSAKAVYAADAGLEWSLYNWFCDPAKTAPCPAPSDAAWSSKKFQLGNGSAVKVSMFCYDSLGDPILPCDKNTAASSTTFKSVGSSGNSSRAFGLTY